MVMPFSCAMKPAWGDSKWSMETHWPIMVIFVFLPTCFPSAPFVRQGLFAIWWNIQPTHFGIGVTAMRFGNRPTAAIVFIILNDKCPRWWCHRSKPACRLLMLSCCALSACGWEWEWSTWPLIGWVTWPEFWLLLLLLFYTCRSDVESTFSSYSPSASPPSDYRPSSSVKKMFGWEERFIIKMIDGSRKRLVPKCTRCRPETRISGPGVQSKRFCVAAKMEHGQRCR